MDQNVFIHEKHCMSWFSKYFKLDAINICVVQNENWWTFEVY